MCAYAYKIRRASQFLEVFVLETGPGSVYCLGD